MFSCCTRTRSKCCLLFLPEAKLLLYFLELLIVNLKSLKREAKYIPLVNEEINLFKSCPGASHRTAAQGWGVQGVVTPVLRQGGGSTALVASTCADSLNASPGPGAHCWEPSAQPCTGQVCSGLRNRPAQGRSPAPPWDHVEKDSACACCSRTSRQAGDRPSPPSARSQHLTQWLVY